jgi:hypothetical protein
MSKSKTVAFDFDGVIHKYRNGWGDGRVYDEINQDVINTISDLLSQGHRVMIFSTRNPQQIVDHMNAYVNFAFPAVVIPETEYFWNQKMKLGVTQRKMPYDVLVDDRCIAFNPADPPSLEDILSFAPNKYTP